MVARPEWETVEIGDSIYSFEMIQPELAIVLSVRCAEAFGGIIASCIPMLGLDSKDIDIFNIDLSALNFTEIQGSLMSACMHIDAKKIKPIFDAVIPSVFVTDRLDSQDSGHRCTYDDFNGKIKTLYKIIFYALRWNFADFFVGSPLNGEAQGAQDV